MMRSLYSGISGLRNHQTRMDVIGNNIANVNTTGYKSSRVIFQDIFSQTSKAGMANIGTLGGINPTQIGLGVKLSSVDVLHTPAPIARTDNALDVMVEGDGYFIVQNESGGYYYTRSGDFRIDDEGYLVTNHGYFVMGYTDINLNVQVMPLGMNYSYENGDEPAQSSNPDTPNAWVWDLGTPPLDDSTAQFDANGMPRLTYVIVGSAMDPTGAAPTGAINLDTTGNTLNELRPIRLRYNVDTTGADNIENEAGTTLDLRSNATGGGYYLADDNGNTVQILEKVDLVGFSVGDDGSISVINNNKKVVIANLGLAMFSNPAGMEKAGNSLYREAPSSGQPMVTPPVNNGAGKTLGGGLEMSNVDLATEFTDMIVTQRGFQANSRIITVSDTMLEEMVNLKR